MALDELIPIVLGSIAGVAWFLYKSGAIKAFRDTWRDFEPQSDEKEDDPF